MPRKRQRPKRSAKAKKQEQLLEERSLFVDGNSRIREQEFHALLRESGFLSSVIEIYRRNALREFEDKQRPSSERSVSEFEEDFRCQEDFLRKYLPNWLYQLTENLALEALYAASGEPMLKAHMSDLYNFIFVERGPGDPPLKDGRNEVWDSTTLKWAIKQSLPKIKVISNVTLAALAKKMNGLPKVGRLKKRRRPLTGNHLQRLLKKHRIDWIKIKKDHIRELEEKKESKKTTSKRKNE